MIGCGINWQCGCKAQKAAVRLTQERGFPKGVREGQRLKELKALATAWMVYETWDAGGIRKEQKRGKADWERSEGRKVLDETEEHVECK